MGSRYLTDLADVCRTTGYTVIEVGGPSTVGTGWKTRARGSGGYNSGLPNHIMCHHTASSASSDGWPGVNYCTFNDDDAPLCNLYLSRKGEIFVCAAGATNTNGTGSDPCGVVPNDSMNSSAIGIEAANDGVGEQWPTIQQDAYVKLCATLAAHYGIPNRAIEAHFEWAPSRKIDPAGNSRYATGGNKWNMGKFRSDVAAGGSSGSGGGSTYPMKTVTVQLPELTKGATGIFVTRMQSLLNANGFACPENGTWDSATENAKVAFDNARGLTPSPPSDCGPKSWTSLLTG